MSGPKICMTCKHVVLFESQLSHLYGPPVTRAVLNCSRFIDPIHGDSLPCVELRSCSDVPPLITADPSESAMMYPTMSGVCWEPKT